MPLTAQEQEARATAAQLIADLGCPVEAVMWLEDQLAGCDCERQAAALCDLIEAAEAVGRLRLH